MRLSVALRAARVGLPVLGGLALVSVALAAGTFSLFGGATSSNGSITLVSNTSNGTTADDFSGISYAPASPLTVAGLTSLSADIVSAECGAGSPRFSIDVGGGKHIFVYLGTAPNFTACPAGDTGNLLGDGVARVDTSQLPGGTQYDTWAHAVSLFGGMAVDGIDFAVDSGWNAAAAGPDQTQTVVVRSITVNGDSFQTVTRPTDKDQCKGGGWRSFTNADGSPMFKNQGDCVSFIATGGKNPPSGR